MPISSSDLDAVKSRFDARIIDFTGAANGVVGAATTTGAAATRQIEAGAAIVSCVGGNLRTGADGGDQSFAAKRSLYSTGSRSVDGLLTSRHRLSPNGRMAGS